MFLRIPAECIWYFTFSLKEVFCRCFSWFFCEFLDSITASQLMKYRRSFPFSNIRATGFQSQIDKFFDQPFQLHWLAVQLVQTWNKYDKYFLLVRANTYNWFDIDLNKKHWFGNNVEGQRGHPFIRTQNVHRSVLVQKKTKIQVKIVDILKLSTPSPLLYIPTKWMSRSFYAHLSAIWIVWQFDHVTFQLFYILEKNQVRCVLGLIIFAFHYVIKDLNKHLTEDSGTLKVGQVSGQVMITMGLLWVNFFPCSL